jgi:uncharacterized membrane protein YqaE (UPF0057 family)
MQINTPYGDPYLLLCLNSQNTSHIYFNSETCNTVLCNSISVCTIHNIIQLKYQLKYGEYFLIRNGKLLMQWEYIYKDQCSRFGDKIEIIPRQKGGFDFMSIITGVIDIVFNPIVAPFVLIGQIFEFLVLMLLWFIKLVIWGFRVLAWFFSDFLNPTNFTKDFYEGFKSVVFVIFMTIPQILYSFLMVGVNMLGDMFSNSFWGWDQSNQSKLDKHSTYFEESAKCKNKKCFLTNNNQVPFSVLLGTILCPPIGVFMVYGISGWINILVCVMLTFLFYLPGLFYALILIYI